MIKNREIIRGEREIEKEEEIKRIKTERKPVKYLGTWLDKHPEFDQHTWKILRKTRNLFFMINPNLKRPWKIKSNIAVNIFESCTSSILDYSIIIFPMMKNLRD